MTFTRVQEFMKRLSEVVGPTTKDNPLVEVTFMHPDGDDTWLVFGDKNSTQFRAVQYEGRRVGESQWLPDNTRWSIEAIGQKKSVWTPPKRKPFQKKHTLLTLSIKRI